MGCVNWVGIGGLSGLGMVGWIKWDKWFMLCGLGEVG